MSAAPTADNNGITRYGVAGGTGQGGSHMPFSRAVEADGWLYVSGQVPMENGEVVEGGIVTQSHKAIQQVLAILKEAGYGPEHVIRCGVWLDDARDFASFNKVFKEYWRESAGPRLRAVVAGRGREGRGRLYRVQTPLSLRRMGGARESLSKNPSAERA